MTDRSAELRIEPVTADRWDDLRALFGPNGAYSNCWCAYFRQTGAEFSRGCAQAGEGNRTLLARLVEDGRVPGLLAYRDDRPVGWVSVAPRTEFGRVLRSPITHLDPAERGDASIWSIVCLYVPRDERRRGVARALVAGAVRWAAQQGAGTVEAYPYDTKGERRASAELYVGTVGLFASAGFGEAMRRMASRPVMRLALR
jgi:GNAT superfamily N-acetyltransferase